MSEVVLARLPVGEGAPPAPAQPRRIAVRVSAPPGVNACQLLDLNVVKEPLVRERECAIRDITLRT